MVHDPHIPHALEHDTRYIVLQGRQQSCCLLWNYWAEARRTSSTGGQVVLRYHAHDLISQVPGILRQHLWMEMHYRTTKPRCAGRWAALPHARKAVRRRRASSCCPREGREVVVWFSPPRLRPGMLCGPTPLERLIFTGLHLLCP